MQHILTRTEVTKLDNGPKANFDSAELIKELYEGKSLQTVLTRASQMLGNPLSIDDSAFLPVLHISDSPLTTNEAMRIEQCYTTEIYQISCNRKKTYSGKISYHPSRQKRPACLVSVIPVEKTDFVFLSLYEIHNPFSESDKEAMEELSSMIAWSFRQKKQVSQCENAKDELFISLLRGDPLSFSAQSVLGELQKSMTGEKRLFLISVLSKNRDYLYLKWIQNQLRTQFENALISSCAGQIVCLLSGESLKENVERMNHYLMVSELKAGCSETFELFENIQHAYRQAQESLNIHACIKIEKPVLFYEECSGYLLMEACLRTNHAEVYCHPALLEIREYDRKNRSNYAEILHSYLMNQMHQGRTAKELGICRGTLVYHLNHMKERFQLDLGDAKSNFRLLLS